MGFPITGFRRDHPNPYKYPLFGLASVGTAIALPTPQERVIEREATSATS